MHTPLIRPPGGWPTGDAKTSKKQFLGPLSMMWGRGGGGGGIKEEDNYIRMMKFGQRFSLWWIFTISCTAVRRLIKVLLEILPQASVPLAEVPQIGRVPLA